MAARKHEQLICEKQNRKQIRHVKKKKQAHAYQHEHAEHIPLYNLDKEGGVNRRRMIYQGISQRRKRKRKEI